MTTGLLADLIAQADRAEAFARQNPRKAARNLANAEVFLLLDAATARVHPLHWLLHVRSPGRSFADTKRSNQSLTGVERALQAEGVRRLYPDDPGFGAAWEALLTACARLGTAPSRRTGGPDWKGRSVFVPVAAAPDRAAVLAAMDRVAGGEVPDSFGPARHWFVRHPATGALLPAKQVWGLASAQAAAEFTAHQARDALRRLGFNVPGPDQPAAEIAESPESLGALPPGIEGAERQVTRNIRERDPAARRAAEAYWRALRGGLRCEACGIDFGTTYGPRGQGFMHFHHLAPLAQARGPRAVAVTDLVPLCPNCHAMVHRGDDMLTPDALRALMGKTASGGA